MSDPSTQETNLALLAEPKAWRMQQALATLLEYFAAVPSAPRDDADQGIELLEEAGADLVKCVEAMLLAAKGAERAAEDCHEYVREIKERRDRHEARAQHYRRAAQNAMAIIPELFPGLKCKTARVTAYPMPSVEVDESVVSTLEPRFQRSYTRVEPNKTALLAAMTEDGEVIEGVRVVTNLVIRVK